MLLDRSSFYKQSWEWNY